MELAQYIRIFRKWFWLIALLAFLGGSLSYITRSRQEQTYVAEVTLFVGNFIQDPNPDTGSIYTGLQLVDTYAALATTHEVMQDAVEAGNFPVSADDLRGRVSTEIIEFTSLLKIRVTYTDPVLAADMANQVAQQLIQNSPTNLTAQEQMLVNSIQDQIDNLNVQLEEDQLDLDLVNDELESATTEAEIDEMTERRDVLLNRITNASSTLAQLSGAIQGLQRQTNTIQIMDPARVPTGATGLNNSRTTILGAIVGAVLAIGFVLVIEYLNDTVRTPEEVTALLGLPILGTIFKFGRSSDSYPKRLITHLHPASPISEGYRALRTNLLFSSQKDDSGKYAFIVSSPGPEEGKSVTAANLAVTMATAGMRVLLVDADLRRPKLHQIFDLDNDLGLTTLLFADPARPEDGLADPNANELSDRLRHCVQNTSIPRLRVVTSGFSPSNPTEILGSTLMQRWFHEFIASSNVDVVLFDTPPTLVVADSAVLAATINVPVLMVLRAGQTRRGAAQRSKEQFDTLAVQVAGVALNSINIAEQTHGYGYGSGYYYYYSSSEQSLLEPRLGWRKLLPRRLR